MRTLPPQIFNSHRLDKFLIAMFLSLATASAVAAPRTINVVLFGYIPDANHDQYAALIAKLKKRFEVDNPDIALNLTIDPNIDVYDMPTLSNLLGKNPDAAQLVEIDTVMLGNLVKEKLVQPLSFHPTDTVTQALDAAMINETLYSVPTYLCSNVIYSPADIEQVENSKDLVKILAKYQIDKPSLIGNYNGSWTLSGFYTDAWADTNTNSPKELPASLRLPLQDTTVQSLNTAVHSCADSHGKNPCLDGTYKDNSLAMEAFARGEANGYVGYTENLFNILSARPQDAPPLHVISAPMGNGEKPVMYVDGLVFNTNCTSQCLDDAQNVAKYLTATATRNLIAFSQDAGAGAIPRYLMQANTDFYTVEPAASNPYYQAYWQQIVTKAEPVPNTGVPENKDSISKALQTALIHDNKGHKRNKMR
ncbi:extracellular solute-binding protein [Candidatus Methylobacter oryzae]|uniref:Extracellular solute-binding protein n=1 Tax=Candidatus Methylobacter oryzae TaxID=2497749 RepID=A0ABY3CAG0_9GAMM|nr:extracellular solute-binding protein [Candidatus Methylobacter oryzae]TRW95147.1 extracellular solute-binding protein [Candidatus Methylobacter oryzae]